MSDYRNGDFQWCAPTTSSQGPALNPAEMWRAAPCLSAATAPSSGARRGLPPHAQFVCTACPQVAVLAWRSLDPLTFTCMWTGR